MKRFILSTFMALSLVFIAAPLATAAYEGAFTDVCNAAQTQGEKPAFCDPQDKNPITETIGNVVTVISFIAGFVAIIIIIWAGLQFIIASGDPAKIAKARQTILYAAVGLVVIVASSTVIQFVLTKL